MIARLLANLAVFIFAGRIEWRLGWTKMKWLSTEFDYDQIDSSRFVLGSSETGLNSISCFSSFLLSLPNESLGETGCSLASLPTLGF